MRWFLLFALTLGACSKGPDADLPAIGSARSLGAEWALVNEQASEGHLTNAYVKTMRESVREQLQTNAKSLTEPKSDYASEIAALLREPDAAAAAALRAHASKLKKVEDSLESA